MSKQKPYEKIAVVLRSAGQKGLSISPEEIRMAFSSDPKMTALLYRLSTYIYDIRKNGGIVRVHKDGRKVVGYELLNSAAFDDEGRPVQKKAAAPAAPAPVVSPVVSEEVEEVEESVV